VTDLDTELRHLLREFTGRPARTPRWRLAAAVIVAALMLWLALC
jgi:hypothetical protein